MAVSTQAKNLYEVFVVFKANIDDDELEKNISQVETAIKNYGGNIIKIGEPLRRTFTHRIKGVKEGYYVSVVFNSPPELPNVLKRTLSISDDVLRYIVVRKDSKKENLK